MKIKIIFMVINMNVGGTEKALLNLISEMPEDQFDITILMLEKYGGFLDFIPSHVQVEYVSLYQEIKELYLNPPKEVTKDFLKKGQLIKALNVSVSYLMSKVMRDKGIYLKYLLKKQPITSNDYDVAVAYAGPMDLITFFVLEKIKAIRKVQWIHFDVTKNGFNKFQESKMYEKFDRVFVVSEEGKNKLIQILPSIRKKTVTFKNNISSVHILNQAKTGNGFKDQFDGLRILTVGRLTHEKGQDLAIKVAAKLIKNGYKFKWYCVGDGNSRRKYEELIDHYDLKEHFILLGSHTNPYPFIQQCDIYVQPSRHEGYCITLAEARSLKKPIVTTSFTGANEQIENGKTGIVVEISEEGLYRGVESLVLNKELRKEFTNNLLKEEVIEKPETEKLIKIL